MKISKEIQEFLLRDTLESFLTYVRIWTTSDIKSPSFPSTQNQLELGKLLHNELEDLGLEKIQESFILKKPYIKNL
jgi:di/tripeptidase